MEYKEGETTKEQVLDIGTIVKNEQTSAEVLLENVYLSTQESESEICSDLLALWEAFDSHDTQSVITKLHEFKAFIVKNECIKTLPGFNEFKIGEVLFVLIGQNEDLILKKFALSCLALLLGNCPTEIFNSILKHDVLELLCSLFDAPYFDGKENIFLALGNILLKNGTKIDELLERTPIDALYEIAIECLTYAKVDFMQFLFVEIISNANLSIEQCETCVDFLFLSFIKKVGLKYALIGFSKLINDQKDFNPQILEEKCVTLQLSKLINSTCDTVVLPYALILCADLAEKDIFVVFNIERIFSLIIENYGQWFCCTLLDSISRIVSVGPSEFIQSLSEINAIGALYTIQCSEFNIKMSITRCLSEILLKVSDQELIDCCDSELIDFILFGIESQQNEVVLASLKALHRIVANGSLSFIIDQSDLVDQMDEISELQQTEEICEIAKSLADLLSADDDGD